MASPSTTMGELEVKNFGTPLTSSFRHSFLPLAASRQDRMPLAPRVITLPSATVGEDRGPGKPFPEIPVAPRAVYSSFQTSSPFSAFRQRMTSFPSSTSREKTYSFLPTSAGVATPSPTLTLHFLVR